MLRTAVIFVLLCISCVEAAPAFAQGQDDRQATPDTARTTPPPAAIASIAKSKSSGYEGPFSEVAAGVKASSLGIGFEGATPLFRRANLRAGYSFLNFDRGLNKDQINYEGQLRFRSVDAHFDFYVFRGFHVSPGLLGYIGTPVSSTATTAPGASFSLGSVSYSSDPNNPVKGVANLTFQRTVAPSLMLGFGNMLPRSGRHFGWNFEFGAAFQGSPNVALNLTGNACTSTSNGKTVVTTCQNAQTDPNIQSNILSEEQKLNNTLKPFKYYPLISLGLSYRIH